MALLLCRQPSLDQGANPFQNADYLVDIRNTLRYTSSQRLSRTVFRQRWSVRLAISSRRTR